MMQRYPSNQSPFATSSSLLDNNERQFQSQVQAMIHHITTACNLDSSHPLTSRASLGIDIEQQIDSPVKRAVQAVSLGIDLAKPFSAVAKESF